jgi:hypothetical protein
VLIPPHVLTTYLGRFRLNLGRHPGGLETICIALQGGEVLPAAGAEHMGATQQGELPPGWETAVSQSTCEIYYVNSTTGESTYELPTGSVDPYEPQDYQHANQEEALHWQLEQQQQIWTEDVDTIQIRQTDDPVVRLCLIAHPDNRAPKVLSNSVDGRSQCLHLHRRRRHGH